MNLFILLFSLLISILCFWFGVKFILLYAKVIRWERVDAAVLSKAVEPSKRSSASRAHYVVQVEYQYFFQGQRFNNNKVYLIELIDGQVNHMKSSAQKVVDRMGDTIKIYVNPKNAQESVVYCDSLWLYILVFFMGFVSILMGISNYL